MHPQAGKITLFQRHSWVSCTVGTYLGEQQWLVPWTAWHTPPLFHSGTIASDWNPTKLKVMLRNPLVLTLAPSWVEEFVQRLVCFMS